MYVVSSWMGTPPLIDVFSLIVWTAKGQQEIVAPRSGSTSEIIMVSSLCEINWCSVFIDVYLWVCVVSSWMGYASLINVFSLISMSLSLGVCCALAGARAIVRHQFPHLLLPLPGCFCFVRGEGVCVSGREPSV